MVAKLESALVELQVEKGEKLAIAEQEVRVIHDYSPSAVGLDVPEALQPFMGGMKKIEQRV